MFRHFQKVLWLYQLEDISDVQHRNRCSLSKCAWRREENSKFDIPVTHHQATLITADSCDAILTGKLWMEEAGWSRMSRWCWRGLISHGVGTAAGRWTRWTSQRSWWRFLLLSLLLCLQTCYITTHTQTHFTVQQLLVRKLQRLSDWFLNGIPYKKGSQLEYGYYSMCISTLICPHATSIASAVQHVNGNLIFWDFMRRHGLETFVVTGRTEGRTAMGHQRLKYLDSLCASWKDDVSPTQLIWASEDRMFWHRMVAINILRNRHYKEWAINSYLQLWRCGRWLRCPTHWRPCEHRQKLSADRQLNSFHCLLSTAHATSDDAIKLGVDTGQLVLLCDRPNRPHYGCCSSTCLSVQYGFLT